MPNIDRRWIIWKTGRSRPTALADRRLEPKFAVEICVLRFVAHICCVTAAITGFAAEN